MPRITRGNALLLGLVAAVVSSALLVFCGVPEAPFAAHDDAGAAGGAGAGGGNGHTGGAPGSGGRSEGGSSGLGDLTIENYPHIDGSTSTLPLARVIACELLGVSYRWMPGIGDEGTSEIVPVATRPEQEPLASAIQQRIVHNKTHQAYVNLVDKTADLILVANTASEEEAAYAAGQGVTLDSRPVALDALVILVNSANTVSALTKDQIRRIFMGQITRWSEVGGANQAIAPYVRPKNSGSEQLMDSIVMHGLTMPTWPEDRTIKFMGALIDKIKSDPLAIGFSVYYYVTYQYSGVGHRVVDVEGIKPTADTIKLHAYPFVADVWVVVRTDLDPGSLAHQLRDWLLQPDGQRVVERSGYVPLQR
jgi:phosphate transport system substrate-binding protein